MTQATQPSSPSDRPQTYGTYIYCVGSARPLHTDGATGGATGGWLRSLQGIGGAPVRLARDADLVAFVSESPRAEYDVTENDATAHEQVIEEAMRHTTVLPMRFGMVAESDQAVQDDLLRRHRDELLNDLAAVEGRVELGVKVLWEEDRLFADILAGDSEIAALSDEIAGTTTEATYNVRVELGERVDAAMREKRNVDAAAILRAVQPLAVETVVNPILSEMMVLNAAFLVERARVPAFAAEVEALRQREAGRLAIRFAGPFPAYNFVHLGADWQTTGEEAESGVTW